MMKKYSMRVLFLSLVAMNAVAGDYCNEFKVRGAAFIPQSQLFRAIYGKAAGALDLEYARSFSEHWSWWINGDVIVKRGYSLGFCSRTRVALSHLTGGVKISGCVTDWITLYAGLGLSVGGAWIKNKCLTLCCKEFKASPGLTTKAGAYFFATDRIFIDAFFDYGYQPTRFSQRKVNVGGAKLGLGIGGTF